MLREVLACWSHGDMAESVAEMRLVRRLVANGQPQPELQHEVFDGGGRSSPASTSPIPATRSV